MAVLPLTTGEKNPILRVRSAEVKKIDRKIKKLIVDMIDTMEHAEGLGIAAPQVGVNLRIFIARLNYGTSHELVLPIINPRITNVLEEKESGEEGCLSLPGRWGIVPRITQLTVVFLDEKGKEHTLRLDGLNARIIQHETDHIDGALFIDRMEREITDEEMEARRAARKKNVR